MKSDPLRAVYTSERAAALSGVPKSTLSYWARHDIWAPSLSKDRPRLWTYSDLLALRMIYWLRQRDPEIDRRKSPMPEVRRAIQSIGAQGEQLGSPEVSVSVDRKGRVVFGTNGDSWKPIAGGDAQAVVATWLPILAAFHTSESRIGPDLIRPRPSLRIIPGKLAGEPHVAGTRIASRSIAALLSDGIDEDRVLRLYPDLSLASIRDSVDLEKQLQRNLAA